VINNIYSKAYFIIKWRRIGSAGHVTRVGRGEVYRVLAGKPEGKERLEDPGVGGRIILRWIIRK
jgi:hypothetical protein